MPIDSQNGSINYNEVIPVHFLSFVETQDWVMCLCYHLGASVLLCNNISHFFVLCTIPIVYRSSYFSIDL